MPYRSELTLWPLFNLFTNVYSIKKKVSVLGLQQRGPDLVKQVFLCLSCQRCQFICHVLNKVSDIWHFCESCVSRPSLYDHAGVRLEPTEPKC